jgi:hypothetical protein
MAIKLFISHSANNVRLAQALLSVLKATFYFRDWEVRCSSLAGYEPTDEILTRGQLSQELHEAELIIFILSPFEEEAEWLRLELALGMASDSERVILLVAGLYYRLLEACGVVDASDKDEIYEMAFDIGERLGWERKPATEKIGGTVENMIRITDSYETLEYGEMEDDEDEDDLYEDSEDD